MLYLVSTPIGNYDDITLRALKVLQSVDLVICEEYKPARRLLKHYEIETELFSLNEHNETESVSELLPQLKAGKNMALISDGGTPLFSDPGHELVRACIRQGISIVPIVGANSLLPALIGSGFDLEKFYYHGWLSPKKEIRQEELKRLRNQRGTIVLLETPYRLKAILSDIVLILGKDTRLSIGFELTTENERFLRGTAESVLQIAEKEALKGEFVIVLDHGKRNTTAIPPKPQSEKPRFKAPKRR